MHVYVRVYSNNTDRKRNYFPLNFCLIEQVKSVVDRGIQRDAINVQHS